MGDIPATVQQSVVQGQNASPVTIVITNTGTEVLILQPAELFFAVRGEHWVNHNLTATTQLDPRSVDPNAQFDLVLTFYTEYLVPGTYVATLLISGKTFGSTEEAVNSPAVVTINLTVTPATPSGSAEITADTYHVVGDLVTLLDQWTPTSTDAGPYFVRRGHTAVWTGEEMIIWGGRIRAGSEDIPTDTGWLYEPASDTWTALPTDNAPSARYGHTAIWTGDQMLVWGGFDDTNYPSGLWAYHRVTNTWYQLDEDPETLPAPRKDHVAIWLDFGGYKGMVIWGGMNADGYLSDGAIYWVESDLFYFWTPMASEGAPSARIYHRAIWTGQGIAVWGGQDSTDGPLGDGAYYIPNLYEFPPSGQWIPMASSGAPLARYGHTAIWTGEYMVIWGGQDENGMLADGGLYEPFHDTWTGIASTTSPEARWLHTSIWTGSHMVLWGGLGSSGPLGSGAVFDPISNTWTLSATSTIDAPSPRWDHSAIWTGTRMLTWGGIDEFGNNCGTGGRYE
ncbi:MAG: hypothetical protein JW797_15430 [Bradymonadales bacterium]|nr:hypothetical protein [Bradymonadales bacterium]